MKKTIRLLVLLAGIASVATLGIQFAQADEGKECGHEKVEGHQHCHHMHHHRFEKMAAKLGLSDQQKVKIKEIFKQNRQQAEAVHSKFFTEKRNLRTLVQADKIDEAAIRAEATKIASIEGDMAVQRAQMFMQIRSTLTPDQVAKFKAMQKEWESKSEKFHHHPGKKWDRSDTE